MTSTLVFRPLCFEEFEVLVRWAALEGWNPGKADAALFWATDSEGFYGCFDNDTLIGGGSIVSYSGLFGFMGFFIVHPDYRAKGLGGRLWQLRRDTLLSRLHPGAAIGMDGVVAMQPFYQQGGFAIAFRDERYEKTGTSYPPNPAISLITPADYPEVFALDLACFGVAREAFMTRWMESNNATAIKYTGPDGLQGFAVLRACQTGYKIGPLFADNQFVAESLYEYCLNSVIGQPVYVDIPVCNEAAVALVHKYEAQYVFECARMYHGTPPTTAHDKIFGITTFELG
ncbi:MAG: hypothetical protein RL427_484 [Bacteroidota bacterium]|jgi:GNAT superfamily N-acetyltransferase